MRQRASTRLLDSATHPLERCNVSKYSIAKSAIAEALNAATAEHLDHGEVIEALIVLAVQESISLRGAPATKAGLRFEEANIAGEVDFDFVRSR